MGSRGVKVVGVLIFGAYYCRTASFRSITLLFKPALSTLPTEMLSVVKSHEGADATARCRTEVTSNSVYMRPKAHLRPLSRPLELTHKRPYPNKQSASLWGRMKRELHGGLG